ncbi:MAG TPA: beta-ketoacyl-[acyl-carrier-protein] synthase family protein [Thermoguttaceae bacterium]|nr:beta-ketoacyl-[acyl-carrier-protein] synthase family protein [Thermoguttaceae bacterium]
MNSQKRRVVITGIGLISPLGNTKESLWEALSTGRSGVGPLTSLPPETLPVAFAAGADQFQGKINDFGPLSPNQKKAIRKALKVMCRECQMGVAAAQLALGDAKVESGQSDPTRTGISFGSDYMLSAPEEFNEGILKCLDDQGQFEFTRWAKEGLPQMSPLWLLKYLPNMPASHLAIFNDLRGPNNSITLREASANAALAEAYQIIVRGDAETMLAGATGTRLHPMKMIHVVQQEELADTNGDPAGACRPFDLDRTGVVLGEGAGAVVLEELATAEARGATIYGEVVSGVSGSALGPKMVARRGRAMANVLRATLGAAGADAEDIGHLNAHGLSTRSCDVEEAAAIGEVFGSRATPLPVVAAKSYFGNLGAGSGMVELIASLMAFEHDQLYPVLNYRTPDPECPVAAVTDGSVEPGGSFVSLNVTPQGQAAAVMVRRGS